MAEEPAPYRDDPDAIPDDAVLMRRVAPVWIIWPNEDEDAADPRVKSGAFQDTTAERAAELGYPGPGMSVHRLDVLLDQGHGPEWLLRDYEGYGLVSFSAGDLRGHDMGVDPRPEPHDDSHAVVFAPEKVKRSNGMQRKTRDAATWEIIPPH